MRDHVSSCFGVSQDRICVVQNGVDVNKFNFSLNHWEFRNRFAHGSEKILLFVGRLVPEKGLDVLIEALPRILSNGIDAKIIAVGEGPQREEYQQMANQYGLAHKTLFLGHVDDWMLRALYRVADVTIVPSKFEPFGIVALEAMAARCPLVVCAVGGLNEIVDHENTGLKVQADDHDALAQAIIRIIRDPGFKDWIVSNAYKKCMWNYNWNNIAEWTAGVYEAALHEYYKGSWKPIF
jgi:glycosyltransferase involved in cell wall biosynthesis